MPSRFRLSLAVLAALAAAPALSADHGPLPSGHDDASYGDLPSAEPWTATITDGPQDDSRMQPPVAKPGTEAASGTPSGVEYDDTEMRPAGA